MEALTKEQDEILEEMMQDFNNLISKHPLNLESIEHDVLDTVRDMIRVKYNVAEDVDPLIHWADFKRSLV